MEKSHSYSSTQKKERKCTSEKANFLSTEPIRTNLGLALGLARGVRAEQDLAVAVSAAVFSGCEQVATFFEVQNQHGKGRGALCGGERR
jgi:hypothetical protein